MLKDMVNAVTQLPFYREVPFKPFGRVFGHLALLAVLYGVVTTIGVFVHLRPKIAENVAWLAANVPPLEMSGGRLRSTVPGRKKLTHPELDAFTIVIDTDRDTPVTAAEMKSEDLAVYLTAQAVYVFNPTNNNFRAQDFSDVKEIKEYVIGPDFYRNFGRAFTIALYPTGFLLVTLWFFCFKLIAALIYSIVGLMINAAMDGHLPFETLYKIAVYAMTPVIVLQMALRLAKGPFLVIEPIPLFRLLAFIIVGVYTWQAIRNIKGPEPAPPPAG